MQITFLTLFLGLISGRLPVELQVTGPVAAVELTLDGQAAGRITAPPWKATVDLGPLAPHELVARALDDKGAELAIARQWIDLPRPPAEVELALESGADGRPQTVRLAWQSVTSAAPSVLSLTFDGAPIPVDRQGRAALPAYDARSEHVLSAEVRFPSSEVAKKDMAFGAAWGTETSSELMAVPLRVKKGASLPPAERLQDWLAAGGRPLHAAAVEEGPAEVLVVRDPASRGALQAMRKEKKRYEGSAGRFQQADHGSPQFETALPKRDALRFLWPAAQTFQGSGLRSELFASSQEFTADDGGVPWLLANVAHGGDGAGEVRLADAVAVAGLQARGANLRRAVVLLLGRGSADASRYDPATVRRYLAALRVPLYVWSAVDPRTSAIAAAWGEVEDVSSPTRLNRAVERLKDDLESQRMVWVEGLHLPQSITLTPAGAAQAELVAAPPPPR